MSPHRLMIVLAVGMTVFLLAGTAGCSSPNNNTGGTQYDGTGMMRRNGSNGSSNGSSTGNPGSGQSGYPSGRMMGGGNSRPNTGTP